MAMTESQALLKIMKAVATPGELANDGECLDEIIFILEELGMPVQEEINKARAQYDDNTYTVENHTEGDK
jgi:hypothetical protein